MNRTWARWGVAALLELAAWSGGLFQGHPWGVLMHAGAALAVLGGPGVAGQSALAAALVLALPGVGLPMALWTSRWSGQDASALDLPPLSPPTREWNVEDVRHLGDRLPDCELLAVGSLDQRRAVLQHLVDQGDTAAEALLRWALDGPDEVTAVDAAMALEDLQVRRAEQPAVSAAPGE